MKYFWLIIILFISNSLAADEVKKKFWRDCPGPACPLNAPETESIGQLDNKNEKPNENELIELKERVKELEMELHEAEHK